MPRIQPTLSADEYEGLATLERITSLPINNRARLAIREHLEKHRELLKSGAKVPKGKVK